MNYAYVCFVNNKSYVVGAIALKISLERTHTNIPFYVVVPPDFDQIDTLKALEFNVLLHDDVIAKGHEGDHFWLRTFFKLDAADLTQFDKVVVLDADLLINKNIDCLFSRTHMSAAVTGEIVFGWKDFNSGVLVLVPSKDCFNILVNSIQLGFEHRFRDNGSSIAGDQDVFNAVYSDWSCDTDLKLLENFNCFDSQYDKVFKHNRRFTKNVYILHFAGPKKPWNYSRLFALKIVIMRLFCLNFRSSIGLVKYLHVISRVKKMLSKI